jgi:hypothetical protein
MASATTLAYVRLYHGTDLASANDILQNGLDAQRAIATGGPGYAGQGEFYAITTYSEAEKVAKLCGRGPDFAVLAFDLPDTVIQDLLSRWPGAAAHIDGSDLYVFYPTSYAVLNANMTNKQLVPVP